MHNEDNFIENNEVKNKNKGWKRIQGFIAGLLAGTFVGTIGTYFVSKKVESSEKKKTCFSIMEDESRAATTEETVITIEETIEKTISEATEAIESKDEKLTTEVFEQLVEDFSKPYIENNINVTEEDLEKFVAIVNIDELAEENPELASELFSIQTKEEYVNDAAKVIGMTYMYNHNIYTKENSTENFINVSDAVHDEKQKEKIEKVENYVDSIATASGNKEEVNEIVYDFLMDLSDPQRELSYLDDGVGFGMQVDIALILNSIARNDLNQENRDWLQELTSSEKYVSNIFTVYDKCNDTYTYNYTGTTYTDSKAYIRRLTR